MEGSGAPGLLGASSSVGRLATLLLLAGIATAVPAQRAHAQDERADLKVELGGLSGQREVKLKVTNLSKWWADETSVTVETVSPAPINRMTLWVENLDPGQTTTVTYTLAADCDGHVVKADVVAAKNYAGVPESNLANNRLQTPQLCSPKTTPKPEPKPEPKPGSAPFEIAISGGPIEADAVSTGALDLQRAVGVVAELKPSVVHPREIDIDVGTCPESSLLPQLLVGWWQLEDKCARVHQLAVLFDLSDLKNVSNTGVDSATLTFGEQAARWMDDDGSQVLDRNCVTTVGRATQDWASHRNLGDRPVPYEILESKIPFGAREWWVGMYVDTWLRGEKPNYGFVLAGQFEDLEATDHSSCLSHISDITLTVNYTTRVAQP